MKARLIILILVAAFLAVYFAAAKSREPSVIHVAVEPDVDPHETEVIKKNQTLLAEMSLPGAEPRVRPKAPDDFDVTIEVDPTGKKNRLYFSISNRQGYYIETLRVVAWRNGEDVTGPEDSPLVVPHYINDYIKANETLRTCIEVVPAELVHVGNDMGTSQDWAGEVEYYHRSRERNPDPLPHVLRVSTCD